MLAPGTGLLLFEQDCMEWLCMERKWAWDGIGPDLEKGSHLWSTILYKILEVLLFCKVPLSSSVQQSFGDTGPNFCSQKFGLKGCKRILRSKINAWWGSSVNPNSFQTYRWVSGECQVNVRWMSGERQISIWAWHWWTWNLLRLGKGQGKVRWWSGGQVNVRWMSGEC